MRKKICLDCRVPKPVSEFYTKGLTVDGYKKYDSYCRKCSDKRRVARNKPWKDNPAMQRGDRKYKEANRELLAKRAAARRAADPIRMARMEADRHLLRKYGLTRQQWWIMLEEQDFTCPGCQRELIPGQMKVCVDHDHETGQNRALLCDDCNKGLGSCKDDPEILERLAAYVRRFKNGHCAQSDSA